jgi:hypothetical protein
VKLLVALALLSACQREVVTSCNDDLHGVWVSPAGRWMFLDNGATVEAYPLFDMGTPPPVIDLKRGEHFQGDVKRRFMQGGAECVGTAPIRIAKCKANTLNIVISEVSPPLAFSPCQWPKPNESRLEHWQRE